MTTFRRGEYAVEAGREVRVLASPWDRVQLDTEPPRWVSRDALPPLRWISTWATCHDTLVEVMAIDGTTATIEVDSAPAWAMERGGSYDRGEGVTTVTVGIDELSGMREHTREIGSTQGRWSS